LGSVAVGGALLVLLAAMGGTANVDTLLPSGLAFCYTFVVSLVLLHRAWGAIQDGHARTSPGKAVGFLLIPWFNFYWLFPSYWGFAKNYNAFLARHQIAGRKARPRLFLTSCILTLVSLYAATLPVRIVQPVIAAITVILWIVVTNELCDAIGTIAAASPHKEHGADDQIPPTHLSKLPKDEDRSPDRSKPAGTGSYYAIAAVVILTVVGVTSYLDAVRARRARELTPEQAASVVQAYPDATAKAESVGKEHFAALPDSIQREISALVDKAMGLLPDSERLVAAELQARLVAGGASSMSKEEFATMTRLTEKSIGLLPEGDENRLRYLFKQISDAVTRTDSATFRVRVPY
jgi:hypothetical protein